MAGMSEHVKPVKVTVSDPETGEIFGERIIEDDYIVITSGKRYVKHASHNRSTHILEIAMAP